MSSPPSLFPQGFMKPRGKKGFESRFLFVANAAQSGQQLAEKADVLQSLFGAFTEHPESPVDLCFVGNKPFVNVVLESVEEARRAKKALHGVPCDQLEGRRLHIEFTEPRPEPREKLVKVQCVSATADVPLPPGLFVIRDFISRAQEQKILAELDRDDDLWTPLPSGDRRIQQFGVPFDFAEKRLLWEQADEALRQSGTEWQSQLDEEEPKVPLPEFCRDVLAQAKTTTELPEQVSERLQCLNHFLANEYLPGQGIRPHVDLHAMFGDVLCALSLRSPAAMLWRNPRTGVKKYIWLPPRTLCVFTGEARYLWHHGIPLRKSDRVDGEIVPRARRVALTMRIAKRTLGCRCDYACQCDYRKLLAAQVAQADEEEQRKQEQAMLHSGEIDTEQLAAVAPTQRELEHVHAVYEDIASHFSHTRHQAWPRVRRFVEALPKGTLALDVGSGNGKYLNHIPDGAVAIGCDRSSKLIEISHQRGHQALVCDALTLPFADNSFDTVFCIAVLHHLDSLLHRVRTLRELYRVAKPGAPILVHAWAKQQKADAKRADHFTSAESQDVLVPWRVQQHFASEMLKEDAPKLHTAHATPSHARNEVEFLRYCHLYEEGELQELWRLAVGSDLAPVLAAHFDEGNYSVIVRKMEGLNEAEQRDTSTMTHTDFSFLDDSGSTEG
ncbi:MAG: hypothetical protein MHM6MM_005236 [Cercozoa sp. M6MM]